MNPEERLIWNATHIRLGECPFQMQSCKRENADCACDKEIRTNPYLIGRKLLTIEKED
jgi:hypothetical protein